LQFRKADGFYPIKYLGKIAGVPSPAALALGTAMMATGTIAFGRGGGGSPSIVQYPHRSSPIRPHAAILPSYQSSFSQLQTRNPPTDCQFHSGRFHGIGRLVAADDLGRQQRSR
jgi:hypothetical protein